MLVLSRRDQETVVIDGNIRITIIRTASNSVRLGIEAPRHVPVHRGEVQERVEAGSLECRSLECQKSPVSRDAVGTHST